jgi:hypothetical protein
MKLHRLAVIYLDQKVEGIGQFSGKSGKAEFLCYEVTNENDSTSKIAIAASVQLTDLQLDDELLLIIPEKERKECEAAIETIANLIALAHGASRKIASVDPLIALSKLSKKSSQLLSGCKGIRGNVVARHIGDMRFDLYDRVLTRALASREEGVAILAEALATTHSLSRFREFVRLFELAFARPFTDIRKSLTVFLNSGQTKFTREEIDRWVDLRHPSTHADKQKTKKVALEGDVAPFIPRMEQAAYDVLFNKKTWHTHDTNRRKRFSPKVSTAGTKGVPTLKKGNSARVTMQFLDCFGAYPMGFTTLNKRPSDWWYPPPRPFQVTGEMFVNS